MSIHYGDLEPLVIEKAYRGFYAYDNNYDGASDSEFPANVIGHGDTPEAAAKDYWSKLGE